MSENNWTVEKGDDSIMDLILAQGAEHTTQDKLASIVHTICEQQHNYMCRKNTKEFLEMREEIRSYIHNRFNITDDGYYNVNPLSYSIEEKYDGYSYLSTEGRFFSKSLSSAQGSKGQPIDKSDRIPHLTGIMHKVWLICKADLHGELYTGGISDDVTKIMGCTAEKAVQRQMLTGNIVKYMLIDIRSIYGISLINEPHRIRRAILEYVYNKYIKPLDKNGYIQLAKSFNMSDPRETFMNIVRNGGEGIIIKNEDALYCPGKKPANNWIKGKKKITHDVFMLGFNKGTGKNSNLFGSIRFGHYIDGKIVECGNCSSGLSDEMRQYIYEHGDEMIERKQVFEIEAIQQSAKSFRNAVFLRLRDDKSASECKPVNIRIKERLI